MANSGAGPSSAKRLKTAFKDASVPSFVEPEVVLCESFSDEDDDNNPTFAAGNSTDSDCESATSDPNVDINARNANSTDYSWQEDSGSMVDFNFIRKNNLLIPAPPDRDPFDYFNMVCNDDFFHLLVSETNQYAEECLLSEVGVAPHSRISRWKPISKDELQTFLGLLFHTGTIRCNNIQDYWKTDLLFNLKCFSNFMSRDRFLIILRFLHFARNPQNRTSVELQEDRLYKIRPMINFFNKRMTDIYYPDKELYIEEPMVLWRGRLIFRQYVNDDKHKFGIKLYMLTEPDGTVLKIDVCTGALESQGGKGLATKVCLRLLEEKLQCGHAVYMDSFYNSFELARELLIMKTFCTGSLNKDRKGNPKDLISYKVSKEESRAMYLDGVMVGKWHDKKDYYYISTEFPNTMYKYTTKKGETKRKPLPIMKYNEFISGIDRHDQMLAYYPASRKNLRWYKKIAVHFFQIMLINSHLLYNKFSGNKMTLYDYRLQIIKRLLKTDERKIERFVGKIAEHLPTKIETTYESGETKRKRCRVCSNMSIRKNTIYECAICPDKPGLCIGNCFKIYHEK